MGEAVKVSSAVSGIRGIGIVELRVGGREQP